MKLSKKGLKSMISKKIMLIIIVCLFIIACKPIGPSPTKPITYINYKTGIEGLDINFIQYQPPDEIYEGSDFTVGLEIQNKGGYQIEEGRLRLLLDNTFVGMAELPSSIQALEGKSQFYPEGEKYMDFFKGKSYKDLGEFSIGKKTKSVNFEIIACYPYKTEATTDICLNPPSVSDYLQVNQQACLANREYQLTSQGSPLVITKIEETIIPDNDIEYKVKLKIYIEKRGDGTITTSDSYYKTCVGEKLDKKKEKNIFEIKEISFSDFSTLASGRNNINCNPFKQVKLENNKAKIECDALVKKSRGMFQTPLLIELDFGHVNKKSKTITIKKIEKY